MAAHAKFTKSAFTILCRHFNEQVGFKLVDDNRHDRTANDDRKAQAAFIWNHHMTEFKNCCLDSFARVCPPLAQACRDTQERLTWKEAEFNAAFLLGQISPRRLRDMVPNDLVTAPAIAFADSVACKSVARIMRSADEPAYRQDVARNRERLAEEYADIGMPFAQIYKARPARLGKAGL